MILRIGVFYVLTWFFLVLLGGLQEATGVLPPQIGLAQWGPGVAALLMLVIFRKDHFIISFVTKQTPPLRYLWALLIPAGVGLLVFGIRSLIPMESAAPPGVFDQMWLVLLWTPLGALGEEIGWRGYLHKKLDTRMRGLVSSVLVGLLWIPIHLTFLSKGLLLVVFLALWFASLSVVAYALVQDTGFSVLVATLFHLSINLINLLIVDVYYQPAFWAINGTVWTIVAAAFVLAKRDLYLEPKRSGKDNAS
jgi:membrane protease YdiL (CAAX protease family)